MQNGFYVLLVSIVRFLQSIFAGVSRLLAPVFSISPLPDFIDFILIALAIVGIVYVVVRMLPWEQ